MTEKKIEAIDLPWDTSAPVPEEVLDLTEARFATNDDKGRDAEFEAAYSEFRERLEAEGALSEATAGGEGSAPSGGDDEDDEYRRFVEQSGMDDFAGRAGGDETREAADMSGSAGGDRTPEGTSGGFLGVEDLLRIAAEDGADLSEDGRSGDDALPREIREAEELNEALLRQAQAEHFGPDEADGAGDEEMWDAYRKAVGEDR